MSSWKVAHIFLGFTLIAATKAPMENPSNAIKTWHCYRYENPWAGLTDSAEAEEKTRHIRAEKMPASKLNRIKPLEGVMAVDDYVLMRRQDSREVTVNAMYFSDLERVDATRVVSGQARIGTAQQAALKKFTPVQILTILLQYQIIQTYIHVESTVHLLTEKKSGDKWMAYLRGQHVYFTNEKNVRDFSFRFTLNMKTGEMQIIASE